MNIKKFQFTDDVAKRHYFAALKVCETLKEHKFDSFFIGGAVRDMLLGAQPKDFDVVTNARPKEILSLPEITKAKYKDTAQAFGVTRTFINIDDGDPVEVEIATYRSDIEAHLGRKLTKVAFSDLDDDIQRRDLTINALAYDPLTHELIDHVDGMQDLKDKRIRFIGDAEDRIKEDPLRILRAVRLRNQLQFSYTKQAEAAISKAVEKGQIDAIATERVRAELTKMLKNENRRLALEDMDKLGIIDHLIPELKETQDIPQPEQYHAEGDVWEHTLLAIDLLPDKPSRRLVWATLLHDIAKPDTYSPPKDDEDRIRFNEHAQKGAEKVRGILSRLRFSNKDIEAISWMVYYHMTIAVLPEMSRSRQYHYMEHEAFPELLELHKADILSSVRPNEPRKQEQKAIAKIEAIWQAYLSQDNEQPPNIRDDLGVDGNWIMENFNLEEGPVLGKLLNSLQDAYLNRVVQSKDDAQAYIKKYLSKNGA